MINLDNFTGSEFQTALTTDLKFTPENINQAYVEQPAKFAYWATLAAQAKTQLQLKSLEVDKQEDYIKKPLIGELDSLVREELDNLGERITESKVSNRIFSHPKYLSEIAVLQNLRQELALVQDKYNLLLVAKEAFVQRKDMIISLGANLRQEVNNIEP